MLRSLLLAVALFLALAPQPAGARGRNELNKRGCTAGTSADRAVLIARHAWQKHGNEFSAGKRIAGVQYPAPGISSESELAQMVARILDGKGEEIANGRSKYWDDATGTIVIFNSRARACGTVFRPNQGRRYYDRQR